MATRIVNANGRSYNFSADDPFPLSSRFSALVRARLIDELTGTPPLTPVQVDSNIAPSTPRVASDGLVGLVGIPRHIFRSLTLNLSPALDKYLAEMTLSGRGLYSAAAARGNSHRPSNLCRARAR